MWNTVGLQRLADAALGGTALGNLTLRLFKSDTTLTDGTVAANLTEANFGGYSAKTLASGSWGAATASGGVATATFAQQTFTATAAGDTVYGWYVTNAAGVLLARARFTTPITIANGTVIRLTPSAPFSQPA